ncbi:hypothetical protein Q6247_25210, partial [Klebsiella pneumoniae]
KISPNLDPKPAAPHATVFQRASQCTVTTPAHHVTLRRACVNANDGRRWDNTACIFAQPVREHFPTLYRASPPANGCTAPTHAPWPQLTAALTMTPSLRGSAAALNAGLEATTRAPSSGQPAREAKGKNPTLILLC